MLPDEVLGAESACRAGIIAAVVDDGGRTGRGGAGRTSAGRRADDCAATAEAALGSIALQTLATQLTLEADAIAASAEGREGAEGLTRVSRETIP